MDKERAYAARILVAITFHFDRRRLGFLAEVLRALAEYPVQALEVIIVTNTFRKDELAALDRLGSEVVPHGRVSIRSYGELATPWHLTWPHKEIITNEFIGGEPDDRYTHFIYLEGDIRLSFQNFCYFVESRETLRGFGLLPAFIRVEYHKALAGFTASDLFWPVYVPTQPHVLCGDTVFLNVPNPYNPFYILDADLAAEYVRSASFDEMRSREVCRWAVADRAALGLCLENVPVPFYSRYVVPVSRLTDRVPAAAWVWHLPNNYADKPHTILGKVRMDQLFVGARELGDDGSWRIPDHSNLSLASAGGPELAAERPGRASSGALQSAEAARTEGQYYLVSHHDTILFADPDLKVLRHAPFGIAPLNLVLELKRESGRLLMTDTPALEIWQWSFGPSDGEVRICTGDAGLNYDVESYPDGQISIRSDNQYLGAEIGGVVQKKGWCRDWERFRLIRADLLDGLVTLSRHRWLSQSDRQIVSLAAQPLDIGRRPTVESSALAATLAPNAAELPRPLVFGPTRIRLFDPERRIVFSPDRREVTITDSEGTLYHFSRVSDRHSDSSA